MRLRTQVLLLQLSVIAVSLGVGFGVVIAGADDRSRDEYAQRALAIAQSVAVDRDTVREVAASDSTGLDALARVNGPVQRQAAAVRERTGALFVVVANADGIRLSHPDPAEVGKHVSTDPSKALSGQPDITTDRGTLGESVRAKVPVVDGRVVGVVSVGVSTEDLAAATRRSIGATVVIALIALAVGAVGSILLARRWQRLTLGLEPDELAELVRDQGAVLHAMADGVLAVDSAGVVRVINDKARQLLEITDDVGTHLDALGLSDRIRVVLQTPTHDPVAATVGDRIVLVSSHRVDIDGRDLGIVASIIDRTDVEELTREIDSIAAMSTALRAQRHETANRFHVLAGLLSRGHVDEARSYLAELTGGAGHVGLDGVENVQEPHLAAFLDAKASHARERGVMLGLGDQTWVRGSLTDPITVTTVVGNLVDNAIDAASSESRRQGGEAGTRPRVEVDLITEGDELLVTVADSGPGIRFDDPSMIFADGVTTNDTSSVPGGRGMGLALSRQLARRLGGDIVVVDPGGDRRARTENLWGGAVIVARLPGVFEGSVASR
ncbi:sensor histidine kinase [Gordonia aichiensis]|uniref:histidine kinase n=1 Tax=Gordonia aichiensis NBRC 108223 TaxID=1220583 RepID=L7KP88_9ACTN|nr:ATP-binding protein [Gordonia aichiensis]GAC50434.1 putative two-component histidine kinase [Gordonia aichiensis NBRC 108223]